MREWVTVTEYVPEGDKVVCWSVTDRSNPTHTTYSFYWALRSPLTGWWFLVPASGDVSRHERLRFARRAALGGNGRRTGGHSEVTHVRLVPRLSAPHHRLITSGQAA